MVLRAGCLLQVCVCVMCFYRGARVRAFFYWSPENMAPGFIGWCWDWISDGKVRARICVYMWVSISMNVIRVVSLVCVRVVCVWSNLKSYGQEQQAPFHCWPKCLLGNSASPLAHTNTYTLIRTTTAHPQRFWWRGHFLVTVATFQPVDCKAARRGAHCSPVDR